MHSRIFLFSILSVVFCGELLSQDASNFTQFFINPYSYNPSYAGAEGRTALFLSYRKQWANIEGGPTIANFSLHGPVSKKRLGYGLNFTNDTRGVLNTSGLTLGFGYTVPMSDHTSIRFGISIGGAWNMVKLEDIQDVSDPALAELLDQNAFLLGSAGFSLHTKTFHLSAALPSIFSPSYVSVDPFSFKEVKPFQSIMVSASNRFYLGGDKHIFEPYIMYRLNADLPSQFEVAGVIHLNHVVWAGGSYKQDFGISALGGFKVNHTFLIGGSYSLKNTGINELNSPSYEVHLSYLLGERKRNTPYYSFVDSEKVKPKKQIRKSASELIAERRKQEEADRKKRQEELAKSQREEQLAKEKAAKEREAEQKQREAEAVVVMAAEQKQKEAEAVAAREAEQKQAETQAQAVRQAELEKQRVQQGQVNNVQQQTPVQPQPQPQPQVTQQQPQQTQAITPIEPPVEDHSHDGGARFRSQLFVPVYISDEENERTLWLEQHANDPDELHGEAPDFHPNSQRHEFVKQGGHQDELDIGDFVIVGSFRAMENAKHFSEGLVKMGFTADYGHLTEKDMWYVYVVNTNDINKAREERDKYRKMKIFRDAWLLTVHH